MSKEIVNRVANSNLITIDLANYAPNVQIVEIDLKQFLFKGVILKEKEFRNSLKEYDFKKYENKVAAIFCSSDCIIPMWAFMLVTAFLNNVTTEIYSGNKENVFMQLFMQNIKLSNPLEFKNKKVIVKGCSNVKLTGDLYVEITKKLNDNVDSLMFGEACSAVPVYKKKK